MKEYRHGARSVFEIHLHLVWTTKYRKRIMVGEVGLRVWELTREVCRQHEVMILRGHVGSDHVHLLVSIPPQVTISRLVQWLKSRSSHHLLAEFAHLRKAFWGRHVWARGCLCGSRGNVADDVIKKYVEEQGEEKDDDFKVEGGRGGGFRRKDAAFSRHPKPPLLGGRSIHSILSDGSIPARWSRQPTGNWLRLPPKIHAAERWKTSLE